MCGECVGTPVPGEIIREKTQPTDTQDDEVSLPPGTFIEEKIGQFGDSRQQEEEPARTGVVRRSFSHVSTYMELAAVMGVGAVTIFTSSLLETTDERKERLRQQREEGKQDTVYLGRGRNKAQSGVGHAERAGRRFGVTRVKPQKKKNPGKG